MLHHRELDAVDEQQFVEGQAQGLGDQDVDLHQGQAAGIVGAQGAVAGPGAGEVPPEVLGQAGIRPSTVDEGGWYLNAYPGLD